MTAGRASKFIKMDEDVSIMEDPNDEYSQTESEGSSYELTGSEN
jgi:hypothetical protein